MPIHNPWMSDVDRLRGPPRRPRRSRPRSGPSRNRSCMAQRERDSDQAPAPVRHRSAKGVESSSRTSFHHGHIGKLITPCFWNCFEPQRWTTLTMHQSRIRRHTAPATPACAVLNGSAILRRSMNGRNPGPTQRLDGRHPGRSGEGRGRSHSEETLQAPSRRTREPLRSFDRLRIDTNAGRSCRGGFSRALVRGRPGLRALKRLVLRPAFHG